MSLINQQGMFQGTPNLNPLPYVQIAIQARQRKAAREDAIDKYYQKLPDTINDKGVRDQEVPIINDYRDKIFEYGLKNKEALRNPKLDRGAAQHGLNKLMNEAKGVARLSQDAAKEDLEIGKLWLSKDNRWVVDDDEFIAANQRHNLPVTDPNFKKVDIPLILQGRPFDQTAFRKELKDFKYSEGTPKIEPHPKDPLMEVVTSNPVLGEDTKASIYNFAADKYHSNRSFRKKIENDLAQTGQLPILQEVFKKTFGKEIESDEDIAAAYTISQLPTSQTRAKVITNKDAVMDRQEGFRKDEWDRRNKITYQQSLNKIRLNNQNRKDGLPTEEMGYVSDEVGEEVGVEQKINKDGKERDVRVIYVDQVDPERLDIITGRDLSKKKVGVKPIQIKQPDGTYKYGYYQDAGTGDWEGLDGQKISREAVKDRYIQSKAGTKFKAQTGTKGSENTNPPKKAILD